MKSKISSALSVAGFALLTPFVSVFAQGGGFGNNNVFENGLLFVKRIMTTLFPIVTAGLILTFGWLVFKFLTDKELEAKEVHKGALIKALFAIFLWFTLFGLIGLLANVVGVEVGKDVGTDDITQVAL